MTEQQQEELIALDAIYPGCVTSKGDSVALSIPIQVDDRHLPPIRATLTLPPSYPDSEPPKCTHLWCFWLDAPALSAIRQKLGELWQGDQVLWSWWEWLGTGEFLTDLSIDLSSLPSDVQTRLADYDKDASRAEFEDQAFSCGVCFGSKKGGRCVRLPCGCVFCQDCITAFWSLAIREGAVDNVTCPAPECVKDRKPLEEGIVEGVVGVEMTRRWKELSEKRLVDRDKRFCFCPREMCEALVPPPDAGAKASTNAASEEGKAGDAPAKRAPAAISLTIGDPSKAPEPKKPGTSDSSRWENFRQCSRCSYTFCYLCRALWHGAHTPCDIRDTHRAVREYLDADDEGRREIEYRLGPRNTEALFALIRDYEREQEAIKWMEEHTTACPCCHAQIEKSEGCNHMSCTRCRSHFCYRCGKTLSAADPYKHYQQPGNCFHKLFDYEPEAGGWVQFEAAWF